MTELRSKVRTVAVHTDLVGHFVVWYVGTCVSREQHCLNLLGRGGKAFCVTAPRGQVKGYWLSAFRRGILPVYSGYMTEVLISDLLTQ